MLLFFVALGFGLIILANVLHTLDRGFRLFDWLLLLLNLPLLALGAFYLFLSPQQLADLQGAEFVSNNPTLSGLIILFMAGWGAAMSIYAVRQQLARWLPLQATSPVHALALVLSGYLMGYTLLTLAEGGVETLSETAVSASFYDLVILQLAFAIIAFLGVGLFIRRGQEAVQTRLGLERPTKAQLMMGARWIPILVVFQWGVSAIWAVLNPEQLEILNGLTSELFGDFDTVWEWFGLALAAGLGEEILFRGALQPVFGLWFTAVLFAISHIQYGLTPATFTVFVIALVLGHVRRQSNTTVAIVVHFGYDFMLGLLALLATYLEPLTR